MLVAAILEYSVDFLLDVFKCSSGKTIPEHQLERVE